MSVLKRFGPLLVVVVVALFFVLMGQLSGNQAHNLGQRAAIFTQHAWPYILVAILVVVLVWGIVERRMGRRRD